MCLTIARPKPVPPISRERERSEGKKRSKMRGIKRVPDPALADSSHLRVLQLTTYGLTSRFIGDWRSSGASTTETSHAGRAGDPPDPLGARAPDRARRAGRAQGTQAAGVYLG